MALFTLRCPLQVLLILHRPPSGKPLC